jgi:hypothetical protein
MTYQPTKAEIEAAAEMIHTASGKERDGGWNNPWQYIHPETAEKYRRVAKAALTAAAKAKETT